VRYHPPDALQTQEPLHVQPAVQHDELTWWSVRCPDHKPGSGRLNREIKMQQTHNGMPAGALAVTWQKSRRSSPNGNCVEMATLPDGSGIAVRNSRDPEGPALVFTFAEVEAFVQGAGDGDFDNLLI
jgi:hypothetical protein